ncbi:hypothetical protein Lal_00025238 [Lupinus albus]|nr:hypothetical protein Lal_00025238 [Lupinus albus]
MPKENEIELGLKSLAFPFGDFTRSGDEGRRLQLAEEAAKTTQARRLAVHSNHAPRRLGWPTTKSTAAPVQARRLELRRTGDGFSLLNGGSTTGWRR